MLSRRNALQAPRCFQAVGDGDGGAGSSRSTKTPQSICAHCSVHVFNATFHERLRTAWEKKLDCEEIEYTQPSSELYRSIQQGCPWCTSIGNAILTSIESDYWHNHFDGEDDGSESGSESQMTEGAGAAENAKEDFDAAVHESEIDGDRVAIDELQGQSVGVEQELDHDDDELARLVETVLTIDLLNCDADIRTTVSCERDFKRGVFDIVRSSTQVTRLSEDSLLPTMDDDAAVEISFEVISPGAYQMQ